MCCEERKLRCEWGKESFGFGVSDIDIYWKIREKEKKGDLVG